MWARALLGPLRAWARFSHGDTRTPASLDKSASSLLVREKRALLSCKVRNTVNRAASFGAGCLSLFSWWAIALWLWRKLLQATFSSPPAQSCCRRTIPVQARHGSRLVFRQGSPLLPSDLSNVAASYARSTVIVSDQSRTRDEADAQSLR
jgi:hypothetical protein